MPQPNDPALRMALRLLLHDASAPEAEAYGLMIEERLLPGAVWTDGQRAQLLTLALRWANRQEGQLALAIRKALGQPLSDKEEAALDVSTRRSTVTRALLRSYEQPRKST